jgi:hypothetical protein
VADFEANKMRCRVTQCCVVLALATAGRLTAQTAASLTPQPIQPYASLRINRENVRVNRYLHDLIGPGAVIGVVGGGLVDQLRGKNDGFESGAEGLAQRIGMRATETAVEVSVRHGLAAAMHRSTEHQPCECHGFGPKVAHALAETFTDRTADGHRALSVPRIAGAYAGSLSGLAWQHDRSVGDVMVGTTLSFGINAVFNVARELTGLAH